MTTTIYYANYFNWTVTATTEKTETYNAGSKTWYARKNSNSYTIEWNPPLE